MKRLELRKILASTLIAASVLALNPIGASAEWKHDSAGWWYADGSSWYIGWKQINGKWYYFDSNGYMAHNRYVDNYYLNSEGYWDKSLEGFSVKYPSNWFKSETSKGDTIYFLDNKGTNFNLQTTTMQVKYDLDAMVKRVKSDFGIDKVAISQQIINGRTVDVLDYKVIENKTNVELQIHQVIFLNKNYLYVFTLGAIGDISSTNMDSFNNMLNTIKFVN